MKKIFLFMVVPLVCMATLSAQISQKEADKIVQQRLESETKPWSVYAREDVQTAFEMTTSTGEALELDYPAWIYFVSYTGETVGKYLIVKESNGNLLEMNTKKDAGPGDLTEWRAVAFEIPFEEYSLDGTLCKWTNLNYDQTVIIINSDEELENYISCTEGSYPEIDFSQHTLLLASGKADSDIIYIVKSIQQLSYKEYDLNVMIIINDATIVKEWSIALMVKKMSEESHVALNIICKNTYYYPTITPGKTWYIEHGFTCPEGEDIGCPCYLGAETIKIGDIRIFNEQEYYELITDSPDQPGQNIVTYVREENGQVLFYVEDCDKEYLMYDYNLEVGDEVFLVDPRFPFLFFNPNNPCEFTEEEEEGLFFKGKVTDIDVIIYDQVPRKRLKVKHNYINMYDYWIEGIGNMQGITWPTQPEKVGFHQLIDCYESDELIFENENPFCWYYP
jgi:hypothetical protein